MYIHYLPNTWCVTGSGVIDIMLIHTDLALYLGPSHETGEGLEHIVCGFYGIFISPCSCRLAKYTNLLHYLSCSFCHVPITQRNI